MAENITRRKITSNKKELTNFEKETIKVLRRINEYKLSAEANVVSIIYKDPELLKGSNLTLEEFSNECWKVYFSIADSLLNVEKKNTIDEITVNLYLEKHDKLRAKYDEFGGYGLIESAAEYIEVSNFDGYVEDLRKQNALVKLAKHGFPVANRLSEFNDMTAEDIYDEYNIYLNDIFIKVQSDIKSYNGLDGLHELIDKYDKGNNIGLPLHNAEMLTKEIGGVHLSGDILGIGASSGCGKSTMAINWLAPSILKYNEKSVWIINEEDETKFKREMIIWACTNIFNHSIPKYRFRDGKFDKKTLDVLHKAADWLEKQKENRNFTIIPLEKYSAKLVCKIIKKYSRLGSKLIILDTFKESFDSTGESWKSMERDARILYDCVKPKGCNVGLVLTYQLSKSSLKTKHLTNSDIGQGRSIVDVFSANIEMRQPFESEYEGGKDELHAFRLEGKNGKTRIPVKLIKGKHYLITFICKNRFGATDQYAILSEADLSTNSYKDIGYCIVPEDW